MPVCWETSPPALGEAEGKPKGAAGSYMQMSPGLERGAHAWEQAREFPGVSPGTVTWVSGPSFELVQNWNEPGKMTG